MKPPAITALLAEHIATALDRPLPEEVERKAAFHILDTFAAMVSGSVMPAGRRAIEFVRRSCETGQARVIGSGLLASAPVAALANGMMAHADETDDSHAPSLTHPGCAVVPAALAMAELHDRSGQDLLRAVVAGYDVGTRISAALGGNAFFEAHHSSHSFGGIFGAAAAAAALAGFDRVRTEHVLAFAVQLASGNTCWRRDPDHLEKAFDFGGMPAHGGVLAASLVAAGLTGASEPLEGDPGLLTAFPGHARPELAVEALGTRFEVMRTAIKKWSVGSPIQAALDSVQSLMAAHDIQADQIARIDVHLLALAVPVVDDKPMPAVNLQQQLALLLFDGTVSFASSHDEARLHEPRMQAMRRRIRPLPRSDDDVQRFPRQAVVEMHMTSGEVLRHRTLHVRGTPENPMTRDEVSAKAWELMAPVLGRPESSAIIEEILDMPTISKMREFRKAIGHAP